MIEHNQSLGTMNSSWNYEFIDDTINASIYETSNGGLVRFVRTGRIFPKWMSLVVSGMVLLVGLRTVVGVTEADQGPILIIPLMNS